MNANRLLLAGAAILLLILILPGCSKSLTEPKASPSAAPEATEQKAPEGEKAQSIARKIIYTGTMTLVVQDFDKAEQELSQLVKLQNGHVVNSEVGGKSGSSRLGQWKVRVPIEHFDAFRAAVAKLGELEKSSTDSQDVTDEYFDLEAHVKNKKVEEARLQVHMEKTTTRLEDILTVERELSRVRGEIERQQGRLQLLGRLSAMTTLTIVMHERTKFSAPESPGFGTRLGRTFGDSWDALVGVGQRLVLLLAAIGPWIVPLSLIGFPLWVLVRREIRKRPGQILSTPQTPSTPPAASE